MKAKTKKKNKTVYENEDEKDITNIHTYNNN